MKRTRWNDDLETWCDERYYRKDEVDEMISQLELNSGLVFSVEIEDEVFSVDSGVQEFKANLSWSNGTGVDGKNVLFSLVDGNNNVLDTSLVTTDVDGYAVYEYTPNGRGQVFVTASYGTLLQETYELIDTFYCDDTSTDTTSNYFINTQSGTSISYENNKVKITCGSQNGRNMIELRTPKVPLADISGKKVRFEVDLSAVTRRMQCNIIQTINSASVTTNGEIITEDGTCYVEADIDSTATLVRFQVIPVSSAQNDTYYLTNFKVYSI